MPKVGRPQKDTIDFFPHYVNEYKVVKILEDNFGAEGYAGYYKLLELIGSTEFYKPIMKTDLDKQYVGYRAGLNQTTLKQMIELLVKIGHVDKELWQNERMIWIQNFVNELKPVYEKRGRPLPTKDGIISGTETHISGTETTQRRGEEKKESKESEESNNSHPSIDLSYFESQYPTIDVNKSFKRYCLNCRKKNTETNQDGFTMWLDDDVANGYNSKPLKFEKYPSGYSKGYCDECGDKQILNDKPRHFDRTDCCSAKIIPEPPNKVPGGGKFQNLTNEVK